MNETLEQVAVNSWSAAEKNGSWVRVSMNFAGMFRLLLWHKNFDDATTAEFLSDLARWRSHIRFEAY